MSVSDADELARKLSRRQQLNEDEEGSMPRTFKENTSVYAEFKEFSRKQIKDFKSTFDKYDVGRDNFIDLMELKMMMEKLGAPQTHVSLKNMIKEVDEDLDAMINFREFLLIFRKAAAGELDVDSGLYELYQNIDEIDVDAEGVKGAKNFFQAKIEQQTKSNKFEEEIRQEQEEKKKEAEEKKERQKLFKEKANMFQAS